MLVLEDVSYETEGKRILERLTMKFLPGMRYVVLGTNGAGKSTIGYVLMGLEDYRPTSGRVLLDGQDITDLSVTQRAKLGLTLMWQEPARFDGITVEAYLTLGGRLGVTGQDVREALEFVGLDPRLYLKRLVDKTLSGGERKRVELASVILLKPRYVILDEPDSGIDLMSLDMINSVINYIAQYGGTPIVITHREEMAYNTDYGYLICAGRVLREGATQDVIREFQRTCDSCTHPNLPLGEELGIRSGEMR